MKLRASMQHVWIDWNALWVWLSLLVGCGILLATPNHSHIINRLTISIKCHFWRCRRAAIRNFRFTGTFCRSRPFFFQILLFFPRNDFYKLWTICWRLKTHPVKVNIFHSRQEGHRRTYLIVFVLASLAHRTRGTRQKKWIHRSLASALKNSWHPFVNGVRVKQQRQDANRDETNQEKK